VIFPNAISEKIKAVYKENFNFFTNGKNVREYDGVHYETETIQTIPTVELNEWDRIKNAISDAEEKNNHLNSNDFTDDYSLVITVFEKSSNADIQKAYLVAKYRKTETWYHKRIKYTYSGGILEEAEKEIYILDGCIDTIISDKDAYILMQNKFESIFNFYENSKNILESNKGSIEMWTFLDDPEKFLNCIKGKKGPILRMARVLQKSLAKLNKLTPHEVKGKLTKYDEFKDIEFDENDRIIVTAKNRDLIIDVLLDKYAKNLFSDELIYTKGV